MTTRARYALTALLTLAAVWIVGSLAVSAYRRASRPPVIITVPAQAAATPLPYTSAAPPTITDTPQTPSNPPAAAASSNLIYVHVPGAVKHPSVYKLDAGTRVFEAVRAAGGALPTADTDAVN